MFITFIIVIALLAILVIARKAEKKSRFKDNKQFKSSYVPAETSRQNIGIIYDESSPKDKILTVEVTKQLESEIIHYSSLIKTDQNSFITDALKNYIQTFKKSSSK